MVFGHHGTTHLAVETLCWLHGDKAIAEPPTVPGQIPYFLIVITSYGGKRKSYIVTDGDKYWKKASRLAAGPKNGPCVLGEDLVPSQIERAYALRVINEFASDIGR